MDIDAKDLDGRTHLYLALKNNQIHTVHVLLENHAQPWSTSGCNYNDILRDNPAMFKYLQKYRFLDMFWRLC